MKIEQAKKYYSKWIKTINEVNKTLGKLGLKKLIFITAA